MRTVKGRAIAAELKKLVERRILFSADTERTVAKIVNDIRKNGDRALRRYALKFDSLEPKAPFLVPPEDLQAALQSVSSEFRRALEAAAKNIRRFCEWQMPREFTRDQQPGIRVGQLVRPLDSVGCYVPGGRYPLPSSLLMTVIPAQVAGVKNIAVASPRPAPETLAAAALFGVTHFYRIGGAQAVAAFAYGTESVPRVQKIVGPGNRFVTTAKKLIAFDCSIDFLAGPTEALVISDDGNPAFIAADLLAQAEHDPDASVVFVTTSAELARSVTAELKRGSRDNPIARESLAKNGVVFVTRSTGESAEIANAVASEHITVPRSYLNRITSAGSIFVGEYSAQSLGDYASGPNHVLPTGGVARYRGGLSVIDYVKIISVQEVTLDGIRAIGPVVETLATAEGLRAHAESVRVRCANA